MCAHAHMQGAEVALTAYLELENSRVMCELVRKLVQMRAVMNAVPPPQRAGSQAYSIA